MARCGKKYGSGQRLAAAKREIAQSGLMVGQVAAQRRSLLRESDENDKLRRENIKYVDGLKEQVTINKDLSQENALLNLLNGIDGLTQIQNRVGANTTYMNMCLNAQRHDDEYVCLLLIDIDHFKVVNDTHGHDAGDKALLHIAQIMQATVRDTDIAFRWGGEELGVLLVVNGDPYAQQKPDFVNVGEKIRKNIEENPLLYEGKEIPLSCCVGISIIDPKLENISLAEHWKRGDPALYMAKESGRNKVAFITGSTHTGFQTQIFDPEVHKALERPFKTPRSEIKNARLPQ